MKLPPHMHVFGPVDTPVTPGFSPDIVEEPTWYPLFDPLPSHYHEAAIEKAEQACPAITWQADSRVQGNITDPVQKRRTHSAYEVLGHISEIIKEWRNDPDVFNAEEQLTLIESHIEAFNL